MWLFLQHFILIPFSYMTFVMREQSDWTDTNYYFDQEQYNFLKDKRTTLTIDESLCLDNDRLHYILRNFE
jgi:hypothetical protein